MFNVFDVIIRLRRKIKKINKKNQAFVKLTKLFQHFLFFIMEYMKPKNIFKTYRILLSCLLFLIVLEELIVCNNYFEVEKIMVIFTTSSLFCIKCNQSISVYIQISL